MTVPSANAAAVAVAEVRLTGTLTARTEGEAETVRAHLPDHIRLTRAEPGCLSFDVTQEGARSWAVRECFESRDAFDAHGERAQASEWGRATAGIARDYTLNLAPEDCRTQAELRGQIDRIDAALMDLLGQRAACIERAVVLKKAEGIPAAAPGRVAEVIGNVRRLAGERDVDPDLAEILWRTLIDHAIARERREID